MKKTFLLILAWMLTYQTCKLYAPPKKNDIAKQVVGLQSQKTGAQQHKTPALPTSLLYNFKIELKPTIDIGKELESITKNLETAASKKLEQEANQLFDTLKKKSYSQKERRDIISAIMASRTQNFAQLLAQWTKLKTDFLNEIASCYQQQGPETFPAPRTKITFSEKDPKKHRVERIPSTQQPTKITENKSYPDYSPEEQKLLEYNFEFSPEDQKILDEWFKDDDSL